MFLFLTFQAGLMFNIEGKKFIDEVMLPYHTAGSEAIYRLNICPFDDNRVFTSEMRPDAPGGNSHVFCNVVIEVHSDCEFKSWPSMGMAWGCGGHNLKPHAQSARPHTFFVHVGTSKKAVLNGVGSSPGLRTQPRQPAPCHSPFAPLCVALAG